MSWSCPHCEKTFSRKDNMQRRVNNRHSNTGYFVPFNAMLFSTEKCQRFQFINYLDDDESTKKRRSRLLRTKSHPYKYSKQEEES